MGSSPDDRGASSHKIWWKKSVSKPELLRFYRNSRWRPPPSCIFKLCEIGTFRRVNNVVLELRTKFGSYIWDRRTYALGVHLMTSRELTSGFDFMSRGHLRMAVMHLPTKFGADIFTQYGVVECWCLPKFKMAAAAILDFQIKWIWNIPACWEWSAWGLYQIQISVIVIEIDALTLQTFIWWRHAN